MLGTWTKSTRCDNSGPNCVEIRMHADGVEVRDSKNPDATPLKFSPNEWRAFVLGVRDGEFSI